MTKRRKTPKISNKSLSPLERYLKRQKSLKFEVFEPTGEVLNVKIKMAFENSWAFKHIGEELEVVQTDFNVFQPLKYQEGLKPWITRILLKQNIEIL